MHSDKCPKCGGEIRFLSGRAAIERNQFCDECGWQAWSSVSRETVPMTYWERFKVAYPVKLRIVLVLWLIVLIAVMSVMMPFLHALGIIVLSITFAVIFLASINWALRK